MKALLLKGPRQLELVDLPVPALAPGQVRMRVKNVRKSRLGLFEHRREAAVHALPHCSGP